MFAKMNSGLRMARKSFALILIVVLVVSMSMVFVLPGSFLGSKTSNSNKYAGYTQMRLYNNTNYGGRIGAYNYVFTYHPTTKIGGATVQGYLSISRQGVQVPSEFPLTTDDSQDYYGITFAITQVDPSYIILMVNTI